jgi:hypothetical protein
MAKGKVHRSSDSPGEDARFGALCKQRHRKLLPLELTTSWADVTCEKCLGKRQAPRGWTLVGSPLAGAFGWLRARFGGPR